MEATLRMMKLDIARLESRGGVGRDGVPHWLPYVSVDDPDATIARARNLGAKILAGPRTSRASTASVFWKILLARCSRS
jgi:hypothetical protein